MTKRRVAIGVTVAVVGIVGLGGLALAAGGPAGAIRHRLARAPFGKMAMANIGRALTLKAELNVTDEQRAQLKTIVEAHRAEFEPVIKNIVDAKRALRAATLSESRDEAAIRKAADDLGKGIGDGAVLASQVAAEVRPVLTADQIQRLQKFTAECDGSVDKWLEEMPH